MYVLLQSRVINYLRHSNKIHTAKALLQKLLMELQ